jgi:hypothetical protein
VLSDRGTLALLLVALLVRLVVLASLSARDPLLTALHSDPAYYDAWARALAAGEEHQPGRPAWLPPLYPWALSALYRVTGGGLMATLVAQGLLGLVTTGLIVLLGERVCGRRAGLAAGWLFTLYLPVSFFETRFLPVNLATPLSVGALLAAVAAMEREREGRALRPAFVAGLLAGLAALARPNLMLALPLLAVALRFPGRRRAQSEAGRPRRPLLLPGLLLLGGALGVAPGLAANVLRSGEPVLVSANGGVNFWLGNNPDARGTFHAPGPEWGAIEAQRDVSVARASAALGREVGEREASRWWFGEGLAFLRERPGAAARLWGRKLLDLVSSREYGVQYVVGAHREVAPALWIAPLPFGLLLLLAALGWIGPARGRGALVAWLAAGIAATLLYFTYSRFRLPLLPALLPFAGRGVFRLSWLSLGAPRTALLSAAAGLALLALSAIDAEDGYLDHLRANAFADMGAAATDPAAAEDHLRRSLAVIASNPKARLGLGRLALDRGDERTALAELEAGLVGGLRLRWRCCSWERATRRCATRPAPWRSCARGSPRSTPRRARPAPTQNCSSRPWSTTPSCAPIRTSRGACSRATRVAAAIGRRSSSCAARSAGRRGASGHLGAQPGEVASLHVRGGERDALRYVVGVLGREERLERGQAGGGGLGDEQHLSVLLHRALPAVHARHSREDVDAGTEALRDHRAGQGARHVRVRRGDEHDHRRLVRHGRRL